MKTIALSFLAILIFADTYAQKLPNVQQVSLRAPANVKIDGKADEWGDVMKAYNTTSNIYYTMANDERNLYLVVQASDVNVINTIFGYGVELAIHKSGRKIDSDKIAITYPLNPDQWANTFKRSDISGDTSYNAALERMYSNNRKITKLKKIIVTGVSGIDTLSIYNEVDISAASQFNLKGLYTVEFAIPLEHLKLSAANTSAAFTYHVTVLGYKPPKISEVRVMSMPGSPPGPQPTAAEVEQGIAELNARIYARNPRTDFWGEYTLAK